MKKTNTNTAYMDYNLRRRLGKAEKHTPWRHVVDIKEKFEEEATPEFIRELCDSLISQLETIHKAEKNKKKDQIEKIQRNSILEEIERIKENFDFLRSLADGSIPETEWDDFCFEGEFEEYFNDYLSQLYDLGDEKVLIKKISGDVLEKFIWVG